MPVSCNTAPDAINNYYELNENASNVTLNVLGNDTDRDGDRLTIVAVNGGSIASGQTIRLASGGLLKLNANGTFSYDTNHAFDALNSGQHATDSFTYKISDGRGGYDTATVTITIDGLGNVCGTNHPPVGVADTNSVVEAGVRPGNTPFAGTPSATGNVLTNDTDVDTGHVLTVAAVNGVGANVGSVVAGTYGSVVIGANGTYTYTLDNTKPATNALAQGATATDVFTYKVTDQFGATSTTTLTICITGTNDAPVAVADTNAGDPVVEAGAAGPGDPTAVGNVLTNDTDVDTGHVLTVAAVNGAGANVGSVVAGTYGSVVIGTNGAYTYTLDNTKPATNALAQGATATEVFTYVVKDEFGATSNTTLTITITGANDAPVATVDTKAVVEAGVNPLNTPFAGTPTAAGNVLTNDIDPDIGAVLTVAAVNGVGANVGSVVAGTYGSVVIGANGAYTYTLDNTKSATNALAQGATATDVFTYKVTDQFGATSTTTLTINITGTNDAPVAVADTNAGDPVVEAGAAGPGDPTAVGNVLANDTDVDTGHVLTVAAVNGVGANVGAAVGGTYGSVVIGANGAYTYTLDNTKPATNALAQGATATEVFTYVVKDEFGAISNTTLTITITGANDAPVATVDTKAVVEAGVNPLNTPFAGTPTAAGNVLTNDIDPDIGAVLTVAAVNGVGANVGNVVAGTYGSVVIGANGAYIYTLDNSSPATNALAQGATATDVFTYKVTDQFGATSTTTLTITITGTNDAPVAVADTNAGDPVVEAGAAGPGDPTAVGNVLANDTDVDTGHVLTVAAVNGVAGNVGNAVGGTYGSVVIGANGAYTYTLDNTKPATNALAQGDSVTEVFHYTVTDEFGATSTTTLTITVTGTNDAPVATVDSNAVVEAGVNPLNTPFAGTPSALGNVLTNDTDVDAGHVLTVAAVAGLAGNVGAAVAGAYGSVVIGANGNYTYTLDNTNPDTKALAQGETTTDIFTYTVTDEHGATSTTTLTINITGTNDAPVAVADTNAGDLSSRPAPPVPAIRRRSAMCWPTTPTSTPVTS